MAGRMVVWPPKGVKYGYILTVPDSDNRVYQDLPPNSAVYGLTLRESLSDEKRSIRVRLCDL